MVVVVLRSPIHANEPSEYNGMLYRTSNRVLNNGIKVIILICMDGTSQYHHHQNHMHVYIDPAQSSLCQLTCHMFYVYEPAEPVGSSGHFVVTIGCTL